MMSSWGTNERSESGATAVDGRPLRKVHPLHKEKSENFMIRSFKLDHF
jgi:hypothetical protein